MKIEFKSKKEAFRALITYLAAPLVLALGVLMALTRTGIREMYTESSRRQAVIVGIIGFLVVLGYSWYKMFRVISIMNSKDYDILPDGPDIPETVICLSCKEPFAGRKLDVLTCPKCGGILENLVGFYERHPELRNDKDNKQI